MTHTWEGCVLGGGGGGGGGGGNDALAAVTAVFVPSCACPINAKRASD